MSIKFVVCITRQRNKIYSGNRCDTRPSRIITDYRLSQRRSIFADEMYSTICVQWAGDHFGLG